MARIDDILIPGAPVSKRDLRRYLAGREVATPVDHGGVGDGGVDCTTAIQQALDDTGSCFLPPGIWRITAPLVLRERQSLHGVGEASMLLAREQPFDPVALPGYPSEFDALWVIGSYNTVRDLRIVGGASAIKLFGRDAPCVKNIVSDLSIWDSRIGVTLDGWQDPDRPCYWNHLARVLIARPRIDGVLLTITPGDWQDPNSFGDTPNANKFHDVRVYSLAAPMTGAGFHVSAGRFNNSFFDCEANLHPDGLACLRLGASCDHNLIVNFYAESLGALPAIDLHADARNTAIVNLFSATGGAPIWDPGGGRHYTAINAGADVENHLRSAHVRDLRIETLSLDSEFIDLEVPGLYQPDLKAAIYLVSAFTGPVEFRLPRAAEAMGRTVRVKKTGTGPHAVTITEEGGPGPDGTALVLANRHDSAALVSNGASWWVVEGNTRPENSSYIDLAAAPGGVARPAMRQRVYLVSAWQAAIEVRLPHPADASGRLATFKKIDPSGNQVSITQQGGGGPDAQMQPLTQHQQAVTVLSDGAAWHVIGRS